MLINGMRVHKGHFGLLRHNNKNQRSARYRPWPTLELHTAALPLHEGLGLWHPQHRVHNHQLLQAVPSPLPAHTSTHQHSLMERSLLPPHTSTNQHNLMERSLLPAHTTHQHSLMERSLLPAHTSTRSDGKVPAPCTHINTVWWKGPSFLHTSTWSDGKVPAPCTHINISTQSDGKVPASCTHVSTVWWKVPCSLHTHQHGLMESSLLPAHTSTRSDGKVPAPCTHINMVWWKGPCSLHTYQHINFLDTHQHSLMKVLCSLHTHQHINMVWQKGLCSLHTQHNLMERSHSLHTHQHTPNKDQCLLAPILLTKSPPQAAVSTLQILLKNQSAWYQMIRSACLPSDISQSSVQCFLDSTITTCPLCALMHKDVNAHKVHT